MPLGDVIQIDGGQIKEIEAAIMVIASSSLIQRGSSNCLLILEPLERGPVFLDDAARERLYRVALDGDARHGSRSPRTLAAQSPAFAVAGVRERLLHGRPLPESSEMR